MILISVFAVVVATPCNTMKGYLRSTGDSTGKKGMTRHILFLYVYLVSVDCLGDVCQNGFVLFRNI